MGRHGELGDPIWNRPIGGLLATTLGGLLATAVVGEVIIRRMTAPGDAS